jgi:glutamate carboxypeptidase
MLRYFCLPAVLLAVTAHAAGLSAAEKRIVRSVDAGQPAAIELLAETVDIRSATENHAGVRRVGDVFARELTALGFETRWVDLPPALDRAGHLVAVRRGTHGRRLLLIGHLDTVLQGEPFRREGERAFGSGTSDMKGGDVIIVAALKALQANGALRGRQVTVVFTGDEEDPGRPQLVSRRALLEAAGTSDVALGFEGASPGLAVIGRRGIGTWRLRTSAEQAHSSGIFQENHGYGAIFEAARILDRFRQELREPYLTYNPSVIVGGTEVTYDEAAKSGTAQGKTNVIPREVQVEGDVRYLTTSQFESARSRMTAIVADRLPRTSATFEIEQEYPSMAPTDANRQLLQEMDAVSRDLGDGPIVAQDPGERGAGDISFACNAQRACLDGLGAIGDHDHAPGEFADLSSLPTLTARAAILIYRLTH